jgi:hypothetical protein
MQRSRFVCKAMFFVLMCSVVFAAGANAQTSLLGRGEVSIGGGASIPLGDFDDGAKTGFLITPRIGYYVKPTVAVGVEYGYFNHGADDDLIALLEALAGTNVDATFSIHQATGYAKVLLTPKPVTPYLRAQLGLYHLVASVDVAGLGSDSVSQNKFGLGGGFGVQFRGQGSVGGFVDAIFHVIFTEDSTTDVLGIQGGLMFFFGTGS